MNGSFSAIVVWAAVFGCVVPITEGCAHRTGDATESAGTLELSLVATSASGTTYRLREATFNVSGTQSASLSTEDDPDATTLGVDLRAGDYLVRLASGWRLERAAPGGEFSPINATLISTNPVAFTVHRDQTTNVRFTFAAGEDVVEFGTGAVAIDIAVVDDQPAGGGGAGTGGSGGEEPVLFADAFDTGSLSDQWVSLFPEQFIEAGWLHTVDTDGWPRDSSAVVHDGDQNWVDYVVSATVGFVPGTPWEHANLLLRVNNFRRASGVDNPGSAYQLELAGEGWEESARNMVYLNRGRGSETVEVARAAFSFSTEPVSVVASLVGPHIQVWLNDTQVIDVIDSDPLPFGGIGVHAIWEAEARFDDIIVTSASQ